MLDNHLLMRDLVPFPLEIPLRLLHSHYLLHLALLYRLISHFHRAKEGEIHAIRVDRAGSAVSDREAILEDVYFDSVIDIIFHRSLLGVLQYQ